MQTQWLLYGTVAIAHAAALFAWIRSTRRHQHSSRPQIGDVLIGIVVNFLDTLGIGSYAQITSLFKLRGRPDDDLIPGTMNVGSAIPSFFGAFLFMISVKVDPILLFSMIISSGLGAWIGAGFVSRMSKRHIQLVMGCALLVAAGFLAMSLIGVIPPSGTAMGLTGWRFGVAVAANFVMGALMCVGIGNYAPSMVLLSFLGMHPIAAYPIMIGSDGLIIPVASMGFIRSGRFDHAVAVGLVLGGVLGTFAAFPLVEAIGGHLDLMRGVVIAVVLYAATSMLIAARSPRPTAS
jgi:Sulfite exporter TauE/SafE